MEEGLSVLDRLNKKLEDLIVKYEELVAENANLKNNIMSLEKANEEKEKEILRLNEEIELKDLELEEILGKIEALLNK